MSTFVWLDYSERGASAIDCWQPNRKSRSWYGLRLISKRSVPLSTGSRINEESQVPK